MIYFIDDELNTIKAYIDSFNDKGDKYTSKPFYYGKEALESLNNDFDTVNLIILDLMMFYGDHKEQEDVYGGVTFLKKIRAIKKYDNIPVLIYTGVDKNDEDLVYSLNYNNTHFLHRDCSDNSFYTKVQDIID